MVTSRLPSLRFLIFGVLTFVVSLTALYAGAPRSESSVVTQLMAFAVLIPPPVLFAAGIFLAVARESGTSHVGVWANTTGIVLHGAVSIVALQAFFS